MNIDVVWKFVIICFLIEEFILYIVIENRKLYILLNWSCI